MDSTPMAEAISKALALWALTVSVFCFRYELRTLIGYAVLAAVIATMGTPAVILRRRRLDSRTFMW